jgi:hypothetical protein
MNRHTRLEATNYKVAMLQKLDGGKPEDQQLVAGAELLQAVSGGHGAGALGVVFLATEEELTLGVKAHPRSPLFDGGIHVTQEERDKINQAREETGFRR